MTSGLSFTKKKIIIIIKKGRIPETILSCIRLLRNMLPNATISVEIERPGRQGLVELAGEADVVFYSRSWAEVSQSPPKKGSEWMKESSCGAVSGSHYPFLGVGGPWRNKRKQGPDQGRKQRQRQRQKEGKDESLAIING
jgi:hypothetical protein